MRAAFGAVKGDSHSLPLLDPALRGGLRFAACGQI